MFSINDFNILIKYESIIIVNYGYITQHKLIIYFVYNK